MGEGSPTKTDDRKKGTLILTSLLEDLVFVPPCLVSFALNGQPQKEVVPFLYQGHWEIGAGML